MATSAPRKARKPVRARAEIPAAAAEEPRPWWHWFLVYPTVGVALITAVPNWADQVGAWIKGVSGNSLAAAERQNALWRKNISCVGAPGAWSKYDNGVEMDATICNSGDIFVQAKAAGAATPKMHWVAVEDILQDGPKGGLIPSADAATPARSTAMIARRLFHRAQFTVLCQSFIDGRYIRRRISTPQGCFDEIIDTFNGAVVQRTQAPCVPQC